MRNTGKPSEQQFENALKALYGSACYIYRIEDAADLYGMNNRAVASSKKPCDYLVTIGGLTHMAEVKSSNKGGPSFSLACLRPNQISAARRMQLASGNYTFYVHNLATDLFHLMDAKSLRDLLDDGKKSVKWSELPIWQDYERYKSM